MQQHAAARLRTKFSTAILLCGFAEKYSTPTLYHLLCLFWLCFQYGSITVCHFGPAHKKSRTWQQNVAQRLLYRRSPSRNGGWQARYSCRQPAAATMIAIMTAWPCMQCQPVCTANQPWQYVSTHVYIVPASSQQQPCSNERGNKQCGKQWLASPCVIMACHGKNVVCVTIMCVAANMAM
ncbi:hypothetical protein NPIL_91211 [Nephila pilipes]|uniref:Uncharacterized protein n=1 Tax=Nephila pilipes TaxID=299642 RepID=A0A8X6MY29_NEPPI|nr:hypothetical protein NPIL_91211 [Nephila pilipes]